MADRVVPRLGQADVQRRADLAEKVVRHLHQDASAVTVARVGARRAAMGEVLKNL